MGVALGIIREGQIVYLKGYGLADREKKIPVSSKSLFRWASVSKPVTAVAAMQLVESGNLSLDDHVRKYVPEFPDKGTSITVRQLLCHQGGIVHYRNGKVIRTKRDYNVEHPFENVLLALDTFRESPLVNPPGEKFSYTTHGYILLSAVVQQAGGQAFIAQVRDRILQPLEMTTMQPDYQWKQIPNRAIGYIKNPVLGITRSTDTDVSWKLGGGGFISNIDDMARFAAGLINGRLLSRQSYSTMWVRQTTSDGKETGYGLGFGIERQNNTLKVSHSGSQEKARTRLVIYPERRHGMVVMSNSMHADPGKFSTAAYRALAP